MQMGTLACAHCMISAGLIPVHDALADTRQTRFKQAIMRGLLMMVANLHTGHRNFDSQVARIERSFGSEVLFIGDADNSNTIAFACKGLLLSRLKPTVPRKPPGFDRQAWDELKPAFERVARVASAAGPASPTRRV